MDDHLAYLKALGLTPIWRLKPEWGGEPLPRVEEVTSPSPPLSSSTPIMASVSTQPIEKHDTTPPASSISWDTLQKEIARCTRCALCKTRKNTVPGSGDLHPNWLIIGEGPGEKEDEQGQPFVGAAGQLLDKILFSLHQTRHERIYIANVLKCRPPANRNPSVSEIAACSPFLEAQIQLLQPKLIIALGRFAAQTLLKTQEALGKLRGRTHFYQSIPVMVSYHPAYLLRNPADKARAWEDWVNILAFKS